MLGVGPKGSVPQLTLNIEVLSFKGNENLECESITFNSKNVGAKCVFVCLKGDNTDGHIFAETAVENGAKVVICERELNVCENEVVVSSTRKALAQIASNFYGNAHKNLKMIAITGTNGKTTTTYMIIPILAGASQELKRITSSIISAFATPWGR